MRGSQGEDGAEKPLGEWYICTRSWYTTIARAWYTTPDACTNDRPRLRVDLPQGRQVLDGLAPHPQLVDDRLLRLASIQFPPHQLGDIDEAIPERAFGCLVVFQGRTVQAGRGADDHRQVSLAALQRNLVAVVASPTIRFEGTGSGAQESKTFRVIAR